MTKPKRSLEETMAIRSAEAIQENARQRQIAYNYLSSGPNIINLAKAAYHYYNGVPWLGGINESGLTINKGDVPTPGMRNPKAIVQGVKTITKANASKITPAQWTAAQDAAIARGDMAEAQRLRDLHFKVSAPDTKIINKQWHNANEPFNVFTLEKSPNGFYFGTKEQAFARGDMEIDYHPNGRLLETYLNVKNPKFTTFEDRNINKYFNKNDGFIIDVSKKDAEELASIGGYNPDNFRKEYVAFKPNQIKLADAVTYDDKGVRIPLGERDNFNIDDIRYVLTPFIAGGIGYGAYNRVKKRNGGSIHIAPSKRGTFTAAASRRGLGVQAFASRVLANRESYSPAMVKKANFARNASKWNH